MGVENYTKITIYIWVMIPLRTRVFRKKNVPSTKPKQKKTPFVRVFPLSSLLHRKQKHPPRWLQKKKCSTKMLQDTRKSNPQLEDGSWQCSTRWAPEPIVINGAMRAPKKVLKLGQIYVFLPPPLLAVAGRNILSLIFSTPNLSDYNWKWCAGEACEQTWGL